MCWLCISNCIFCIYSCTTLTLLHFFSAGKNLPSEHRSDTQDTESLWPDRVARPSAGEFCAGFWGNSNHHDSTLIQHEPDIDSFSSWILYLTECVVLVRLSSPCFVRGSGHTSTAWHGIVIEWSTWAPHMHRFWDSSSRSNRPLWQNWRICHNQKLAEPWYALTVLP